MVDIDSRDKLINNIENFISGISPNNWKKLKEEVEHDNKITNGQIFAIYMRRLSVEKLSDAELYWLIYAISKVTKKVGKPEDYFEESEIKSHKYYLPEEEKQIQRPFVFKDVIKLADNQYMFPCSIKEIKKLKDANILQIVPELQRNSTKNRYDELRTKVNQKSAQQIADLIDDGKFFYNSIRFNLMDDGESDEPIYNEEKRTLTIGEGTIIVPDGNHRTIGCELAKKHLDDKFCVLFTFLSVYDTRSLLNQEWTTVPIPKKHKDSMKQTNANAIVDGIIRSVDADTVYSKEIVRDGNEIKAGHGFILYSTFADAINKYYNVNKPIPKSQQDEIRDWLISFMNCLTENLFDDFRDYKKARKIKWSVLPNTSLFYVMISKVLYDNKEDWRNKLKDIIGMYDFSDKETRNLFASSNKRGMTLFCDEQEERIRKEYV